MTNWKDLFGDEICKCGNKGVRIVSNGSGQVKGFQCEECYEKEMASRKFEVAFTLDGKVQSTIVSGLGNKADVIDSFRIQLPQAKILRVELIES